MSSNGPRVSQPSGGRERPARPTSNEVFRDDSGSAARHEGPFWVQARVSFRLPAPALHRIWGSALLQVRIFGTLAGDARLASRSVSVQRAAALFVSARCRRNCTRSSHQTAKTVAAIRLTGRSYVAAIRAGQGTQNPEVPSPRRVFPVSP